MATFHCFGLQCLCTSNLFLIDATSLWTDELYSVGKSFQPSFSRLMAMLREDTPSPRLIRFALGLVPGWHIWLVA